MSSTTIAAAISADSGPASTSSTTTASSSSSSSSALLDFFLIVGRCKIEKRTGWVNEGVREPESVADHMYRMAVMALVCVPMPDEQNEASSSSTPNDRIDPFRASQIALVHDLAEALVGDITPTQFSGVSKQAKHQLELDAMMKIRGLLVAAHNGDTRVADRVHQLWIEYEAGMTPTAKYVKNLDKLDMYLQAYEYQQREVKQANVTSSTPSGTATTATPPHASPSSSSSLFSRLDRFYTSMPETRAKIDQQDSSSLLREQAHLDAVIAELQHRRTLLAEQINSNAK